MNIDQRACTEFPVNGPAAAEEDCTGTGFPQRSAAGERRRRLLKVVSNCRGDGVFQRRAAVDDNRSGRHHAIGELQSATADCGSARIRAGSGECQRATRNRQPDRSINAVLDDTSKSANAILAERRSTTRCIVGNRAGPGENLADKRDAVVVEINCVVRADAWKRRAQRNGAPDIELNVVCPTAGGGIQECLTQGPGTGIRIAGHRKCAQHRTHFEHFHQVDLAATTNRRQLLLRFSTSEDAFSNPIRATKET